jgi:SulP family sulfate permease
MDSALTPSGLPIATALREGLKNYSLKTLKDDAIAGLVVSLVALPLSMALAIAVGLPPRHGLHTAIVAGIAAAIFGGSSTQVSGPTAAFVVIVAPIVSMFGVSGIVLCQFMAGALLIMLGFLRAGRLIRHVPHAVVTGFTAGIAVTIGTLALNDFFGLGLTHLPGHYIGKAEMILSHLPAMKIPDAAVGAVSLLVMAWLPRVTRAVPSPAAGIAAGALLAWTLSALGMPVDTLATRFSYMANGALHHGVEPYPPHFGLPRNIVASDLIIIFPHAMMIAALAALESLLSATVADSIAHTRHDPDAELTGIGIANIFSGLAAGIPATGAIARTATNIHAGARTPVAAVIHALLILFYMVFFSTLISAVPMAALAALLLMTAWRMSHLKQFVGILKLGRPDEKIVLVACFLLTVFIDMVAGVGAGLALALLFFFRRRRAGRLEEKRSDSSVL